MKTPKELIDDAEAWVQRDGKLPAEKLADRVIGHLASALAREKEESLRLRLELDAMRIGELVEEPAVV